jgi:hypothetical protein
MLISFGMNKCYCWICKKNVNYLYFDKHCNTQTHINKIKHLKK